MYKFASLLVLIAGAAFASDTDRAPAMNVPTVSHDSVQMMTVRDVQIKQIVLTPEAEMIAHDAVMSLRIVQAQKPEDCLCGPIMNIALGDDE